MSAVQVIERMEKEKLEIWQYMKDNEGKLPQSVFNTLYWKKDMLEQRIGELEEKYADEIIAETEGE